MGSSRVPAGMSAWDRSRGGLITLFFPPSSLIFTLGQLSTRKAGSNGGEQIPIFAWRTGACTKKSVRLQLLIKSGCLATNRRPHDYGHLLWIWEKANTIWRSSSFHVRIDDLISLKRKNRSLKPSACTIKQKKKKKKKKCKVRPAVESRTQIARDYPLWPIFFKRKITSSKILLKLKRC